MVCAVASSPMRAVKSSLVEIFFNHFPNPKIEIKKNTQTPTGIMISTKISPIRAVKSSLVEGSL
jgi:hypothetical protein